MTARGLIIAAPRSGAGKTTVTLGLLAALKRRGVAVRAAKPVGDGFYGVDIKQADTGYVVMEVNDNPNLEHGIEDAVSKDEVWVKLLRWFIERFEQ